MPRCKECRHYGHLKKDCVRTYTVSAAKEDAEEEMLMDEAEVHLAVTDDVADSVTNVAESTSTEVPQEADVTEGGPTEASTVIEESAPVAAVAEQPKPHEPTRNEELLAKKEKNTVDTEISNANAKRALENTGGSPAVDVGDWAVVRSKSQEGKKVRFVFKAKTPPSDRPRVFAFIKYVVDIGHAWSFDCR